MSSEDIGVVFVKGVFNLLSGIFSSKNDNSYTTNEKINNLNILSKYNNINKNSFISNFDNKEKVEKIINQINDKDKK